MSNQVFCGFCMRKAEDCEVLVRSRTGICICDRCAVTALKTILAQQKQKSEPNSPSKDNEPVEFIDKAIAEIDRVFEKIDESLDKIFKKPEEPPGS